MPLRRGAGYSKPPKKPIRCDFPCACTCLGETSSAAVTAMNSRRFIRSSLQLEDEGTQDTTSQWSSHSLRVQCCVADAARDAHNRMAPLCAHGTLFGDAGQSISSSLA